MKEQLKITSVESPLFNQSFQEAPPLSTQAFPNDEIDLRELFFTLWRDKWTIIICILVAFVCSLGYAFSAQEWWSSTAKVSPAQKQDYAQYQTQVSQFQPLFDTYQDDGVLLINESLSELIDKDKLFQQFVSAFNSSRNKRNFLEQNQFYQGIVSSMNGQNIDIAYAHMFKNIKAAPENKKDENSPYILTLQTVNRDGSYSMMNGYIKHIEKTVLQDALNNLQALIDSKEHDLLQQKKILEEQAQNKIRIEIARAQLSLKIASVADITEPTVINDTSSLFDISMGSKAIEAKIDALESIKNLSVVEDRIQQVDAKLMMLNSIELDKSISFKSYRFIEEVTPPITRDKPKRALIVVLGLLLGGMLGVAIVLIRSAFSLPPLIRTNS